VAENLKQTIEFQAKGIAKLKKQYKELEQRTRGLEGATNKAGGSLGGLVAKLGLTTAALYGTMRAISGVVSVGREFTKNMSNVAAISGATGKELEALEANARQLGSTTVFTASQVAELQTEFAKLGFSSKQIQGVTKDTLALAAASGSDLATSAAVAGQTLRAFGLDVSETARVTDTMALSFSSSALDMEKFTNSMQYVAPIAKQVGISVEGTTAMLGTLANAGISGSMAGTSLRKILLELGNENSALTKKIGFSVKTSDDLVKAFEVLSKKGIGVAEAKDLVGQRAISAFNILLEGTGSVKELAGELENAGGAAQKMADVQLDNLDGSLTLLNSAMEGLGLRLFEFVEGPLRETVDGITAFTSEIDEETIRALTATAAGFATVAVAVKAYNVAIKLAKLETAAFQATLIKTGWGALAVGAGLLAGEILKLTGIFGDFGVAVETATGPVEEQEKAVDDLVKGYRELTVVEAELERAAVDEELNKKAEAYYKEFNALAELRSQLKEAEKAYKSKNHMTQESYKTAEENYNQLLLTTEAEKNRLVPLLEELDLLGEQDTALLKIIADYNELIAKKDESTAPDPTEWDLFLEKQEKLAETQQRQQDYTDALIENYPILAQQLGLVVTEEEKQKKIKEEKEKLIISELKQAALVQGSAMDAMKAVVRAESMEAAAGYIASIFKNVPFPLNLVAAAGAGAVVSGLIDQGLSSFAQGGDYVTSGPELIKVGDNPGGKEHVQITPLSSPNTNGPQGGGITVNISGGVVNDDYIRNTLMPALNKADSMGA